MAGNSIDNLEIKINSKAEGAVNQIDDLVKKLGNLTKALDQATVDPSIASGLELIAKGAKKFNEAFGSIDAAHIKTVGTNFKDLAAGINNVNKAINGVDFMKLANQASQLDTMLDRKLNETLDEFGIKGTKNINSVKTAMYEFMSALRSGNLEIAQGTAFDRAEKALRSYATFPDRPGNNVTAAQELIDAVRKAGTGGVGIDSKHATEVAQIKEGMSKYANVFTTSGNAKQSIDEFITQNNLLIQQGVNEANTFRNLSEAITNAIAVLNEAKNATISYDQAIKTWGMDEDLASQKLIDLLRVQQQATQEQEQATQVQRQNAESMRSVSGLYQQFAQGLREVASVEIPEGRATSISNLANAVSQFGYAKIQTATQVIPALTREISNMLNVLSKSPEVSKNITRLINALARLTANGQTLKVATNAIANGLNRTGNSARRATPRVRTFASALRAIHSQSISVIGSLRRLAGIFGTVYASLFMLVGAFHKLKEAIGYAADLTEIQNVVDVTFGNAASKVDEFTKTSIKDFGMNELSVKKFASQFQSMGVAMGITNEQVKDAHKFLSQFKTPTGAINGYNEMSNSMADMSINLTKLTADLASFYDQDQETVAKALQSGIMSGQTRPLRAYGIDLTQATLQEWLLSQGIEANIQEMTQAEKTMVRYQYAMQRLGMAQGDYQRTMYTWANQVRLLKQQFQALGAIIGQGLIQALKPALIAFNQFLGRVTEFAQKVLNALGKIFGWEIDVSAGTLDTDLDEAEELASGLDDALSGVGDSADDASDAVKELNKQVQGFDKLNILTTSTTKGTKGSGSGSGSGSGVGDGSGLYGASADPYVQLKKTAGLFESEIDNLFDLGSYISKSLQKSLDDIKWPSIYEKARGFGKGLADFLNGLFAGTGKKNVFASLGRTVAGAINTAINFFDSFAEVFDFDTFGQNLASFFVETISNIDWTKAGKAFHEWMQGIKRAFSSFVSYLWENRDEVWKAIKDFFSEVTIEDIAIAVGIMSLSKITKWLVFGHGAKTLAVALAKWIGTVTLERIGLSIGVITAEEVGTVGIAGLLGKIISAIAGETGLNLAIMTGAETAAAGVATFALPIAFAIVPLIFHKILRNMYEDAKEAGDEVKKSIIENAFGKKASISRRRTADGDVYDVDLQAVINWKTLFGKLTDNLPWKGQGFVKWLLGKIFNWYKSGAENITTNANGDGVDVQYQLGVDFKLNSNFGNGKFSNWLKETLGIKDNNDTVTATTGIKQGSTWQSGKKEYQSVHDDTATKTIAGKTDPTYTQKKLDYNSLFSNTATKTIAGKTDRSYTNGKYDYNSLVSNTATKTVAGAVSYSFWQARADYNSVQDKNVWVTISAVANNIGNAFTNALNVFRRDTGGILAAAGWRPIQGYATGGMPSSAEVFMARENGLPEMVGRIGGHTAVMNNDQIVASVASGVAQANAQQNELLRQQNALLKQILAKEVGITSGDIFDAVRSENRNYTNRTGKSAFSF